MSVNTEGFGPGRVVTETQRDDHPNPEQFRETLQPSEPSEQHGNPEKPLGKNYKVPILFRGNLILDCPVPKQILDNVSNSSAQDKHSRNEYTHMRYSAVTCSSSDFNKEKFQLRPSLFAVRRMTEILVVLTLKNEGPLMVSEVLGDIQRNIDYICRAEKKSPNWGNYAWKNIVVCIVTDDNAKMHPETRDLLKNIGLYQSKIARASVFDKAVTANIYEYTVHLGLNQEDGKVNVGKTSLPPTQIILCILTKPNPPGTDQWIFDAFEPELSPRVCIRLGVKRLPRDYSIHRLWKSSVPSPRPPPILTVPRLWPWQ
jgi:chitin synthase